LERLEGRLRTAEQRLDHLVEKEEVGSMAGQQAKAGQRCVVLQIRAELAEMMLTRYKNGTDAWLTQAEHVRRIQAGIKEAEHAERTASKQLADDTLRDLMRCREQKDDGVSAFHALA